MEYVLFLNTVNENVNEKEVFTEHDIFNLRKNDSFTITGIRKKPIKLILLE